MARVEIQGGDDPAKALRAIIVAQNAATKKATAKSAHLVERNVKLQLSKSSHPKGTKTPSKPGEPPSLITGTLRRSVKVRGPRKTSTGYEAVIGPTAVYGRIQEFGGRAGRGLRTTLPARPYVRPGTAQSIPGIKTIFGSEWRL